MSNDDSSNDDGKIDLSKKPTAKEEAQDFSNSDDKRKGQDYAHQLALMKSNQGPIGGLIGCSDSSLTIAFYTARHRRNSYFDNLTVHAER